MMKIATVLVLLALGTTPRGGGAQIVNGTVVEDSSHTPLAGVTVTLLRVGGGPGGSARADGSGAFLLVLERPGSFLLRATHPSYKPIESDTLTLRADEAVTLELRMAREAIVLEPLVVTARVDRRLRAFHDRARTSGFGSFITRSDIERRGGTGPAELLRGVPGVRLAFIAPCAGCVEEEVIFLRGVVDRCIPTVLIDGLAVKQDANFPLKTLLAVDQIEGVEVYVEPGVVPPALGGHGGSCGLVAFWTRSPEGGKLTWKRLAVAGALAGLAFLLLR